jgi:hypothetical protein
MDRFLESTFPDEIAIGRLAAMTTRKVEKGRMEPDIIPSLAMLLEVHGTHQKYDRVLNRARRRLGFKIFLRRIFLGGRAVTFDDALEVMMGAG